MKEMRITRILMIIIAIGWIVAFLSTPETALGVVQTTLSLWLLILAIKEFRQARKEQLQDNEGGNYGRE